MAAGGTADLDSLRDSGSTVIFCPMAVARYAVVLESFDRYLRHGIRMGMGTDTAPPDMIRALDTGLVLTKAVERRKDAAAVADLYRAATTAGADALGRPDLGRLSEGAQADLVVFDLTEPQFGPVDDPIRSLVLNGDGRDVRRVVVADRVVVEDGRIPGRRPGGRPPPGAGAPRALPGQPTPGATTPTAPSRALPPTFRMVRRP